MNNLDKSFLCKQYIIIITIYYLMFVINIFVTLLFFAKVVSNSIFVHKLKAILTVLKYLRNNVLFLRNN